MLWSWLIRASWRGPREEGGRGFDETTSAEEGAEEGAELVGGDNDSFSGWEDEGVVCGGCGFGARAGCWGNI